MIDGGKISAWVQKAVANIAAFDGNLRRVDSEAEKKALGQLLAGDLSNEDKEYIEGFMLDRRKRAEKFDGHKPQKNEERSIEVPNPQPGSDNMPEEQRIQYAKMYADMKLFFDEKGNIIKNETRDENGVVTRITSLKHINENEIECIGEQKMPEGGFINYRIIGNPATKESKILDHTLYNSDGKPIVEIHNNDDGTHVFRQYIKTQETPDRAIYVPENIRSQSEEEIADFISKVHIVEESIKDDVAIKRYLDSNGEVLATITGNVEKDKDGYMRPVYPEE